MRSVAALLGAAAEAAATSSSSTSAGPASPTAIDCPALQRGTGPGIHRDRPVREPARPALPPPTPRPKRPPTSTRCAGRSDSAGSSSTATPTGLCSARPTRCASRRACAASSSTPPTPATTPTTGRCYPAGLDGLRIACRRSAECSGDPVAPLPPRRPPLPRRRPLDRGPARLPARRRHPGAALLPQPRRSRPPLPRRRPAPPRPPDRPGIRRPRRPARILLRDGDRGRVQRLPLLWDPAAPTAERVRQLSASVAALPADYFAPFSRREYLFSRAAHLTNCLIWPAPPPGGPSRRSRPAGGRRRASRPWSSPARSTTSPRSRRRDRWPAASRARASTWCPTAATPRASTSPSARPRSA